MKFLPIIGVVLCAEAWAAGPGLQAGLARIDITPPAGHPMGGYSSRTAGATRTHDPLYATVLLLESGDTSLALVTCDLRSFVSTRVSELAKRKFGVSHTIVSVSHTHSGPLTWEARTPWYAAAEDQMVEAIGRAKAALFPAEIAFVSGSIHLGFNRRRVIDGKAEMWWRNAERLPSHPVDPTLNVLRVSAAGGPVRAVLVNYACHPSVLGPDNLEYSADYPGALKRYVESQSPGAMCLFVQGGAGDLNPYRDKEPVSGAGFAAVTEMGEALGKQVLALVGRARPMATPAQALRLASEVIEVKNRWKPDERIPIGISAGVLNDRVCFLALPGEPFVEHQLTFRAKSECPSAMLFGYSYSSGGVWAGYLPTIRAAVEGGYGAGYNTTVEVGTGERLIDRGIAHLLRLRGLLQDLPDPRY